MLDEPIHLEKHNPLWKQCFIQEQKRIQQLLHINPTVVEHIGSTAIPGIDAKPIIDIMIGAETFPPPQFIGNELVNLGYEAMGEAGVLERLYFRLRGLQAFNVHLVERGGRHWKLNLAFRDYLRTHPEAAKRYETVKRQAVQSGATSLLEYSEAKSAIVQRLLSEAITWQTETL